MTVLQTDDRRATATASRRRAGHRRGRLKVALWQLLFILVLIGIWQLAATFEWGRKVLVRSPKDVVEAFGTMSSSGELWSNYGASLQAALIALVLAIVIGAPVGLFIGSFPMVSRVFNPILNAVNATPRIALAPVFIVIFGINSTAKVALAFSLAVFVMIINAQAGMVAADQEAVRMLTVMGARKSEVLYKVILPAAVPSLVAGARLTVIFSLLGVISAELIAARDGLGQVITRASGSFDMAKVYAILILLVVTAAVLNALGNVAERRLLRWQPPRVS
ncbi:ABC transporter permease subunit [Nakamurella sp. YIM 132087]|uniref:ABC transporter permease subunit n=1 Tax=Nakamurella alba TaxID=2665158 RepID=A0A7K1FEN5_9ACTN|nr:ABC transporter permease [Nakamurella alba]MTD12561.1 ABC transporter permease subunit [Nakamurella alba]